MAEGVCAICGERLLSPYAFSGEQGEPRCGSCRRQEPAFTKAAAYGSYDGGLRELIHLLKFEHVRPAANVLGRMLLEVIAGMDPLMQAGPVVVIPVPLHSRKLRQRGFNQSELIASCALKLLSQGNRFLLRPDVLVRVRETQSQIGLTPHQRRENIRGAFAVSPEVDLSQHEILLVDDVLTTGTTASECARVLRRAGASKVWVATVARTLKQEVARLAVPVEEDEPHALAAHG